MIIKSGVLDSELTRRALWLDELNEVSSGVRKLTDRDFLGDSKNELEEES